VHEVELLASMAEAVSEPAVPELPPAPFELKFDGSYHAGRRG
jgi:hypothetical protein